ncbi:unnamed protein product [Arctogadus glacialis]
MREEERASVRVRRTFERSPEPPGPSRPPLSLVTPQRPDLYPARLSQPDSVQRLADTQQQQQLGSLHCASGRPALCLCLCFAKTSCCAAIGTCVVDI